MRIGDLQVGDTLVPIRDSENYTGIVIGKKLKNDRYTSELLIEINWFYKNTMKPHEANPFRYSESTTTQAYKKGPRVVEQAEWE